MTVYCDLWQQVPLTFSLPFFTLKSSKDQPVRSRDDRNLWLPWPCTSWLQLFPYDGSSPSVCRAQDPHPLSWSLWSLVQSQVYGACMAVTKSGLKTLWLSMDHCIVQRCLLRCGWLSNLVVNIRAKNMFTNFGKVQMKILRCIECTTS